MNDGYVVSSYYQVQQPSIICAHLPLLFSYFDYVLHQSPPLLSNPTLIRAPDVIDMNDIKHDPLSTNACNLNYTGFRLECHTDDPAPGNSDASTRIVALKCSIIYSCG
jgi:hypothetical protein